MRLGRALAAAAISVAVGTGGCTDADAERSDLCGDLDRLAVTFELVTDPPEGATVGAVRGGLEKVAPTLDRAAGAEQVGDRLAGELAAVEEALRDALADLGDDEPAAVATEALGLGPRMSAARDDVIAALGCGATGERACAPQAAAGATLAGCPSP